MNTLKGIFQKTKEETKTTLINETKAEAKNQLGKAATYTKYLIGLIVLLIIVIGLTIPNTMELEKYANANNKNELLHLVKAIYICLGLSLLNFFIACVLFFTGLNILWLSRLIGILLNGINMILSLAVSAILISNNINIALSVINIIFVCLFVLYVMYMRHNDVGPYYLVISYENPFG
jgi:hypothetical protein